MRSLPNRLIRRIKPDQIATIVLLNDLRACIFSLCKSTFFSSSTTCSFKSLIFSSLPILASCIVFKSNCWEFTAEVKSSTLDISWRRISFCEKLSVVIIIGYPLHDILYYSSVVVMKDRCLIMYYLIISFY